MVRLLGVYLAVRCAGTGVRSRLRAPTGNPRSRSALWEMPRVLRPTLPYLSRGHRQNGRDDPRGSTGEIQRAPRVPWAACTRTDEPQGSSTDGRRGSHRVPRRGSDAGRNLHFHLVKEEGRRVSRPQFHVRRQPMGFPPLHKNRRSGPG